MQPNSAPKFHVGQLVKITLAWADNIPPATVEQVTWDTAWGCYTYALAGSKLRIDESSLRAVETQDLSTHQVLAAIKRELDGLRSEANSWRHVWGECKELASVREVSRELAIEGTYSCSTVLAETLRRLDERSPAPQMANLYKELITQLKPLAPEGSRDLEWDVLPMTVRRVFEERNKLRSAGINLRTYLESQVGPIKDIPDPIYRPFLDALDGSSY